MKRTHPCADPREDAKNKRDAPKFTNSILRLRDFMTTRGQYCRERGAMPGGAMRHAGRHACPGVGRAVSTTQEGDGLA